MGKKLAQNCAYGEKNYKYEVCEDTELPGQLKISEIIFVEIQLQIEVNLCN